MLSIVKQFEFEAAHRLPNHTGKCKRIHGHTYKLEIEVTGKRNDVSRSAEYGMIMDFGNLSEWVNRKVVDILDHSMLNDFVENPTAENIVQWIVQASVLDPHSETNVIRVRLWETSNSYCEWRRTL